MLAGGQSLMPLLNLREVRPRGSSTSTRSPASACCAARDGDAADRRDRPPGGARALPAGRRALAAARPGRPPRRPPRDALARDGRRLRRPRRPRRAPARPPPSRRARRGELRSLRRAPLLRRRSTVPPLPAGARTAYAEYARTRGVFADAGAAVVLAPRARARSRCSGPGRADRTPRRRCTTGAERARGRRARRREVVEGDHRRALVADVTRRALERGGPRVKRAHQRHGGYEADGRAADAALRLHPRPGPDRHEGRLRARGVRRVHRPARRRARALVPDARRPGRRVRRAHDRGPRSPGRSSAASTSTTRSSAGSAPPAS